MSRSPMSRPPKYLDADQILDARNAWAMGVSLPKLAGLLGVTLQELRAALNIPEPQPAAAADDDCDLWAADRLGDQL